MRTRPCVVCGEQIPPKRLEAMPHTKTCVACSSEDRKQIRDLPGSAVVQHTGGLHEKYLKEEDLD
jgi:RNA polymerase-binding transcription factor DksA